MEIAQNHDEKMWEVVDRINDRIANNHCKPASIATPEFRRWLLGRTSWLSEGSTTTQRVFHLTTSDVPVCIMCRSPVSWRPRLHQYSTYCSSKCAHNDAAISQKTKDTLRTRYGVEHCSQIEEVKKSKVETAKAKYGVTNNFWANRDPADEAAKQFKKRNVNSDNIELVEKLIIDGKTQAEIGETLGISQPRVSALLARLQLKTQHLSRSSTCQREIRDFISSFGIDVVENSKVIPPHDVDIYIPSHNMAIEVDGVFWHSELSGKDRKYHLSKTTRCNENGIQLIHMFDIEWNTKREIVKSRLRSVFNASTRKIYARNCTVRELSAKESKLFFSQTHIQGGCPARTTLALIHNDEIVSAMSFGVPRYNTRHQYELLRFSSALNTSVVGGASKLFTAFIRTHNPTSIISYSDKRWNTGNVYAMIGFEKAEDCAPNYYYFNRGGDTSKLYHRMTFQKHKLSDMLDTFDPTISGWENMMANGYDRIWDCGNTKWVWLETKTAT